jgi:hypothetical protein
VAGDNMLMPLKAELDRSIVDSALERPAPPAHQQSS